MLLDFLYTQDIWAMACLVVFLFIVVALLGLALSSKLIPKDVRKKHMELVSYGLATISIFSAVLLAFIAVSAWESHGKAETATSQESLLIADVLRSSFAMPEPLRSQIREGAVAYLDTVINEEWPAMANKNLNPRKGWDQLVDLYMNISKFKTTDPTVQIQYASLYDKINSLIDARRIRILAEKQSFQPIVWGVVLVGAFLNIAFLFLFSMESFRMHVAMTSMVAAGIGAIFVLIIAFDRPFQGSMAVSSEAFSNLKYNYTQYKQKY